VKEKRKRGIYYDPKGKGKERERKIFKSHLEETPKTREVTQTE